MTLYIDGQPNSVLVSPVKALVGGVSYNVTFPAASFTVAGVGLANSWSVDQVFVTGKGLKAAQSDASTLLLIAQNAAGQTQTVLTVVGAATVANSYITAQVGGTWTVVGTWTIPAVTLGGAVAGGDQSWTNVGDMTFAAGSIIASGAVNGNTLILRANDTAFVTLTTGATDVCTLANITMSGTWLASGTVTLPAITMGGTLAINGNSVTGIDAVFGRSGQAAYYNGGADGLGAQIQMLSKDHATEPGWLRIGTPTLGVGSLINRLLITGGVATAVATWSSIYHVGMKFGLAGTATGAWTMDGATSGVVTVTVAAVAGTWTMTLPTGVAGVGGYQLTDAAGDGICSWSGAGSKREWKNILGKKLAISPSKALDRILNTKVYPFTFKKGFGTGCDDVYQGVLADEAPWAMHFQGGILNPISTFGHTVLAIQALQAEINDLKARLISLSG